MTRLLSLRLADMLDAIARIRRVMDGVSLEAFEEDGDKCWIVERGLEIISEASRHLTDDVKARHTTVPWRRVADTGNLLRHAYDRIAPDILWKLVNDDLSPLEAACRDELPLASRREAEGEASRPDRP